MIQVKLSEIVGGVESIKSLLETKLPVKVSYRLSRLSNKIQSILTIYEENRNKLVKEYGDAPDEEGNIKVTDPEKLKKFGEELSKVLDIEESIDFDPIKVEDLGDVVIAPKDLVAWIFVE